MVINPDRQNETAVMQRIRFILVPLALFALGQFAYGQPTPLVLGNATNIDAVTMIYDPSDGQFNAVSDGADLTTLEIQSAGDWFIPTGANRPTSPFDLTRTNKLFRLAPDGVSAISFGQVLPTSLTASQVINDLIVDGSLLGGGNLQRAGGGGPYLFVVPEPSSSCLLLTGLVVFRSFIARRVVRRKRI